MRVRGHREHSAAFSSHLLQVLLPLGGRHQLDGQRGGQLHRGVRSLAVCEGHAESEFYREMRWDEMGL